MDRLVPPEASRWRLYRLAALGAAWMIPVIISLRYGMQISFVLSALLYPTVRKAILLAGIGLQGYRLLRPATARPRVYEYAEGRGEVAMLVLLLVFDLSVAWTSGSTASGIGLYGFDPLSLLFRGLDWLLVLALFAFRTRAVIDGAARTIAIGDVIPRTYAFDAVRGLGMIELRLLRRGVQVGTQYYLALFFPSGAPRRLKSFGSSAEVDREIQKLAADTGIPIAPAR